MTIHLTLVHDSGGSGARILPFRRFEHAIPRTSLRGIDSPCRPLSEIIESRRIELAQEFVLPKTESRRRIEILGQLAAYAQLCPGVRS
jgi:hypothetical protein